LIGQVSALGAEAHYLGIVTDNKELIISGSVIQSVGKYDVLIVTGGASVGDYDFVSDILTSLGARLHFSSLNIQSGKPVLFATLGNTHMIGLSGNPVSSFLQFLLVVKPLLLRLAGCTLPSVKIIKAPIGVPVKRKKSDRQLFVPVTFNPSGFAEPVRFNGSAHITALTGIDGFAILDVDVNKVLVNQLINILLV
jgi:molybdopterin molybdotransferase